MTDRTPLVLRSEAQLRRVTRVINIQEILELIPQRPPLLMVDRILDIEPFKTVIALKNVSADEPYFAGHFPTRPIMPGVMMLECIAQAATVLGYVSEPTRRKDSVYFLCMDNVKFKRLVIPGDALTTSINVSKIRGPVWKFSAQSTVDGELAVKGDFLASFVEEKK